MTTPRIRRRFCFTLVFSLAFGLAAARDLDGARVLERLQAWLSGTRDLVCRFEQTLVSGALGAGDVESGRLQLLRPGHMRWDYLEPERKTAILEGHMTLVYLPEDRQLLRGRLSREGGGALHALFAGEGRLADLFEATLVATPDLGGQGSYRIRLVPKNLEEAFEEVILTLRPASFAIEEAEVLDSAGNHVRYRFTGIRRNRGLSPGVFELVPPPGTEILDER